MTTTEPTEPVARSAEILFTELRETLRQIAEDIPPDIGDHVQACRNAIVALNLSDRESEVMATEFRDAYQRLLNQSLGWLLALIRGGPPPQLPAPRGDNVAEACTALICSTESHYYATNGEVCPIIDAAEWLTEEAAAPYLDAKAEECEIFGSHMIILGSAVLMADQHAKGEELDPGFTIQDLHEFYRLPATQAAISAGYDVVGYDAEENDQ